MLELETVTTRSPLWLLVSVPAVLIALGWAGLVSVEGIPLSWVHGAPQACSGARPQPAARPSAAGPLPGQAVGLPDAGGASGVDSSPGSREPGASSWEQGWEMAPVQFHFRFFKRTSLFGKFGRGAGLAQRSPRKSGFTPITSLILSLHENWARYAFFRKTAIKY